MSQSATGAASQPSGATPILRDPSNEVCPSYDNSNYSDIIKAMMAERKDAAGVVTQPARTKEQAIGALKEAWKKRHDRDLRAWEAQQDAEAEKAADALKETEARVAKKKAELQAAFDKKRPKIPDWESDNVGLAEESEDPLPAYAVKALKESDYIPLWCFLPAAQKLHTNKLGITDGRGIEIGDVKISGNTGTKLPKECLADEDLTWEQVCLAITRWLKELVNYGYKTHHVRAWSPLMTKLMHLEEYQDIPGLPAFAAIILYVARTRRDWYKAVKGNLLMFNPSVITQSRFERIVKDLGRIEDERTRVSLVSCVFL
jgi:hypothetical protein